MKGEKKLKKYPKKPKAGASVEKLQAWLDKCKDIDKMNKPIIAYNKKLKELREKVKKAKG